MRMYRRLAVLTAAPALFISFSTTSSAEPPDIKKGAKADAVAVRHPDVLVKPDPPGQAKKTTTTTVEATTTTVEATTTTAGTTTTTAGNTTTTSTTIAPPPPPPPPAGFDYLTMRPFAADSPFNTPFPAATQWFDSHTLHFEPNGAIRRWWASATAADSRVWVGKSTDPLWTFNMPNYIAGAPFNRNRPAQTFTMHGPANMDEDHSSDHLVVLIDQSTGQYAEVWNSQVNTASRTITGQQGNMGWATGDILNGLGAGSPDGKNAGVRATNCSWIGGVINGRDISRGVIDHALAIAAPGSMFSASLVRWPATSPDLQGRGPLEQGTRFGIPAGTPMPAGLTPIGQMAFRAIQTYGMYLLDFGGLERPSISVDANTVTDAQVRGLYADWEMPGGLSDMDRIAPLMRVADYQPVG